MPVGLLNTLADAQAGLRCVQNHTQDAARNFQNQTARAIRTGEIQDVDQLLPPLGPKLRDLQDGSTSALQDALSTAVSMLAPTLSVDRNRASVSRLREWMLLQPYYLKSRGVTYNAAAAGGSNIGNAVLRVQSVDWRDKVIQTPTIEGYDSTGTAIPLKLTCLGAANSPSSIGIEAYEMSGGGVGDISVLQDVGPGTAGGSMTARAGGIATSWLTNNASFDDGLGTAANGATYVPGWYVVTGYAGIARDTANYAFDRGSSAQASLKLTANCTLQFRLRDQNVSLNQLIPYILSCFYKSDGATGTLAIRLGNQTSGGLSTSVAIGGSVAWTQLTAFDTAAPECWPKVFDTDGNPCLEIKLTNFATGGGTAIWVDDVLFDSFDFVAGRWAKIQSGTTGMIKGDYLTQACVLTVNTAGSVDLTGGGSGSIDSILVGGVELLRSAIPFTTSLAATAQLAIDHINDPQNRTSPAYRAYLSATDVINIRQIVPVEGTITVVSTCTTITKTDINMSGASLGMLADTFVRLTGDCPPCDSSATGGFGDT